MTKKDDVARLVRKLAEDVLFGKYGDDELDGECFWMDWDELQDEILMEVPDPNAE